MKIYLKIQFSSEGPSPLDIIKKVEEADFKPVVGDYDFATPFNNPEEYGGKIEKLHHALKGTKVHYTLTTKKD